MTCGKCYQLRARSLRYPHGAYLGNYRFVSTTFVQVAIVSSQTNWIENESPNKIRLNKNTGRRLAKP